MNKYKAEKSEDFCVFPVARLFGNKILYFFYRSLGKLQTTSAIAFYLIIMNIIIINNNNKQIQQQQRLI